MSASIPPSPENDPLTRPKHPGGRPSDPVWEYFEKTPLASSGHFSAKCNYCKTFTIRGRPNELRIHLAKNCKKCPDEIRLKYLTIILADNNEENQNAESFNKRCRVEQTTLDDHWDDDTEIPKYRQKIIDRTWLKAFISCGIPFSVIENPFFIDAIKSFRSLYNPPSRNILSGNLLDYEVIKIDSKVNNILKNMDNLTLGMNYKNIYLTIIYNYLLTLLLTLY